MAKIQSEASKPVLGDVGEPLLEPPVLLEPEPPVVPPGVVPPGVVPPGVGVGLGVSGVCSTAYLEPSTIPRAVILLIHDRSDLAGGSVTHKSDSDRTVRLGAIRHVDVKHLGDSDIFAADSGKLLSSFQRALRYGLDGLTGLGLELGHSDSDFLAICADRRP